MVLVEETVGPMTRLTYAIKYVADMDAAVAFHRDQLGLRLKFASPEWTEFLTGETTLALHIASADNPAGRVELGFAVDGLDAFYAAKNGNGLTFVEEPRAMHGMKIASVLDSEGQKTSVSG